MVDKIVLGSIASFQNDTSAVAQYNANNALLTTSINNTLSRDGTSPNQMSSVLDMNSNQIINLPAPSTTNSPARLIDVVSNPTITIPGTGTSGHVVPYLDGNNIWSGTNSFSGNTTAGFSAHKNGTNQTGIGTPSSLAYTLISFGTAAYNRGGFYNTGSSTWTPPAGLIQMISQVWLVSGVDASGNNDIVIKIIKNGSTDVKAGITGPNPAYAGTGTAIVSCFDVANGTDYYQVEVALNSAGSNAVADGNAAHTYFQGSWLGN